MTILVLCEPAYTQTVQCDARIKGILCEARRRRIPTQFFTDPAAIRAMQCDAETSVILLFDSIQWLQEAANVLAGCSAHFILAADLVDIPLPIRYSQVGTDMDAAVAAVTHYLHNRQKSRIALVDIKNDSLHDRACITMLAKHLTAEGFHPLSAEEFFAARDAFDTVLCTDDVTAAYLAERLTAFPRAGEKHFIVSLTDTGLARFYRSGITSIAANDRLCGQMAVNTHLLRTKHHFSRSVNLLPAELVVRESAQPSAVGQISAPPSPAIIRSRIGRLARTLATGDLLDLKIIYGVLCHYNYEKIHEAFFILPNTARYRMRKLRTSLGAQSKQEIVEILHAYLHKENLLSIIHTLQEQA